MILNDYKGLQTKIITFYLNFMSRQGHLKSKYQKGTSHQKFSFDVQLLNIKMILSDYKGLNSENLARLTLTLGHTKVIKGQDIKKKSFSLS